jgi:hypothetical protein
MELEVFRSTTRDRRATLTLADVDASLLPRPSPELTMRIFPIALIVIGALGVAKYLGLIPVGMLQLIGPVLLIALGVALVFRRPRRCGYDWRASDVASRTDGTRPTS